MLGAGGKRTHAAALAVTVGALITASPATAATRYAEPDGDGPFANCPQSDPCDLQTAVEAAVVQDGDVVVVLPGTYLAAGDQLNIAEGITVRGKADAARPTILSNSSPSGVNVSSDDARVRGLQMGYTGSGAGLSLQGGTAERVVVDSAGNAACSTLSATIRDSVCWNHASGVARAVVAGASGGGPFTLVLRNVTAVAPGENGSGVEAQAGPSTVVSIDAKGVIASGGASDAVAVTNAGTATVTLDHSNYLTESESGGATVTDPGTGTNQTEEPIFVDAAGGDFHQFLGSPTINAGAVDNLSGTLDLDEEPRTMGPASDIGADEFDPTPPETTIRKHPRKETKKRKARFKFAADHPGSTFECKLDDATFANCESPAAYQGLQRGKHVFRVRATDPFGKSEPRPAKFAWKIGR